MKLISKLLGVFLTIIVTTTLFSCESKFKEIQNFNKSKFFPASEVENMRGQYIDSGKVKAILVSPKMLDYSNVKYPFTEFPKGIHLTIFDKENKKNTVVADYAIRYTKTDLIDLQGNVVITTHDGKKLNSDQLYYDQKNEWFFTEGKYLASTDSMNFTRGVGVDFDSKMTKVKATNSYAESLKKDK
ncbi:LPS export ABC transporter periplasmic protein LptC [Myroides marinus]|jgi:LPS export ABC transporter protein LptC|uniref:LPS export ABC transporter periplasmic protein LptC n=1 Tax=Myroides marinus TaxID=703342 RepID=A0A163XRU7_9FLAO|nr:LPS export ABC transporter periplasmic protein LptC [Myroides marinus]MDR0229350.1 LPS export ABC transporter periplasmic protein LptC [Flavobacteriaceae bacterium]KUF42015.1 LPS export ABC transporter periplasmic protein LptC [Myroides marinus]KZE78328.1 LPS export ABC transporter periplasmic protein LptC [Myroides marinus]MDM1348610.1 LPS export ABC transporter periplasmic protein LptC [Myroides marinus]MDM1352250.1 LPS export ABC transporter periplasmic protein LptC [Myroides marinus]